MLTAIIPPTAQKSKFKGVNNYLKNESIYYYNYNIHHKSFILLVDCFLSQNKYCALKLSGFGLFQLKGLVRTTSYYYGLVVFLFQMNHVTLKYLHSCQVKISHDVVIMMDCSWQLLLYYCSHLSDLLLPYLVALACNHYLLCFSMQDSTCQINHSKCNSLSIIDLHLFLHFISQSIVQPPNRYNSIPKLL